MEYQQQELAGNLNQLRCLAAIGDNTIGHPKTTHWQEIVGESHQPKPMLSTAVPIAPPSTLLLHHRRRRRRYLDSHLHLHSSHLSPRPLASQHPQPHPLSTPSPLRFDRAASPSSPPANNTMGDYRHMRSGSLNIPSPGGPPPTAAAAAAAPGQAHGRFDGPRSPPSTSQHTAVTPCSMSPSWTNTNRWPSSIADTSHVPCKFFRQGACQAGSACPFSHDLGAASETVCKYFAKVRAFQDLLDTSAFSFLYFF